MEAYIEHPVTKEHICFETVHRIIINTKAISLTHPGDPELEKIIRDSVLGVISVRPVLGVGNLLEKVQIETADAKGPAIVTREAYLALENYKELQSFRESPGA